MKDYSDYYSCSKDKILSDGARIFQLNLQGFDAVDAEVNGHPRRLIITEKYSVKEQLRKVIDEHGKLKVGDLIFYSDSYWLVRKMDKENPIFDTFTIECAPSSLRWLNEYGEVEEYYFIFNSENLSNFGVEDGRILMLPNDRRNIAIRNDESSQKIKVDQRFIFDQSAWKVISINRLNPLVEIVLQSDLIDTVRDNVEERIADYDKAAFYSLKIINGDNVFIREDQTFQINVEVKNRDSIIANPELIFEVEDPSILTVDVNGLVKPIKEGSTVVRVRFKNLLAEIQIKIDAIITDNFTVIIIGEDIIKYNISKTYQAQFFNNGKLMNASTRFWITAEDGVSQTSLAVIDKQDPMSNTCVVRANDKAGYILLHVEDSSGLIGTSKKIRIKSLL